jgi:glutamate formiminotransferase / 5-formyltetrahydrofolate cyclo-ligase
VPDPGTSAECVINISEGRDHAVVALVAGAAGTHLLDVHSDRAHHRSVLTLGGPLDEVEAAARAVARAAVAAIDLTAHSGIHPRLGVLDVVPFVPLATADEDAWAQAVAARNRFATWAGSSLDLPCFLYGPERSLPDLRRHAFSSMVPDTGPGAPHPTAGACAVGARLALVAYNVWIAGPAGQDHDGATALSVARSLAADLRGPSVRTLGLPLDSGAQVSCNLIGPSTAPIAELYDTVVEGAGARGCSVVRAELVGLLPEVVLRSVPRPRWQELDLAEDRTIEFRMAERKGGADGG